MGRAMKPTAKVPNASRVPTSESNFGKNSLLKTSAAAVPVEEEVVPLDRRADEAGQRDVRDVDLVVRHDGMNFRDRTCVARLRRCRAVRWRDFRAPLRVLQVLA